MLKFRILSSAIILLTTTASTSALKACQNGTLLQKDAKDVVDFWNDLRAGVLKGKQKNGHDGKYWPAAMSMPPVEWNCFLEGEARRYLEEKCADSNNAKKPAGFTAFFGDAYEMIIPMMLYYATSNAEFTERTIDQGGVVKYNDQLREFSNFIRSATTKIGCSAFECKKNQEHLMACTTDQPDLTKDETIYEVVDLSSACPTNPYMTDNVRSAFLLKHNTLRITLALGTVKNGKNDQMLGEAKNMPTMTYDCGLEKTAYEKAKQCGNSQAEPDKENVFEYTKNLNKDFERVANKAVQKWWSEFKKSQGINYPENIFTGVSNSNSFAKIASDSTYKVGCAIVNCTSMINVVCRYETKVKDGQRLYGPGTKCEKCEDSCVGGLCPAVEIGAKV